MLTKLQRGHTLSAASHSELLCVPGIYHFILHLFADSVVKLVEPVIVLIYKGQAAGPNPHKFTWYDCSGQCHLGSVVCISKQTLGSCFKCQAWPYCSTWEARWGWKGKDRAQKGRGKQKLLLQRSIYRLFYFVAVQKGSSLQEFIATTEAQLRTAWALWGLLPSPGTVCSVNPWHSALQSCIIMAGQILASLFTLCSISDTNRRFGKGTWAVPTLSSCLKSWFPQWLPRVHKWNPVRCV